MPEHAMKRLAYPNHSYLPYIIVLITYAFYAVIFASAYERFGRETSALAIFPVIAAAWYFGMTGGLLAAMLCILPHFVLAVAEPGSAIHLFENPGDFLGSVVLLFLGLIIGRLATVSRERREALARLELYEQARQSHAEFLKRLNEITVTALEADNLRKTLDLLMRQIGNLFQADEAFFFLWDETRRSLVPRASYDTQRDICSFSTAGTYEQDLATAVIDARHPIAVTDVANSPYNHPETVSRYPNRSRLALPFMVQDRRLGALLLGYNQTRSFTQNDLLQAALTAEQISLVLSKSLLLEEERKQVRQLTALHDIALISIEVDNENELIRRVTDVIGQNLFPDNFGILLLDQKTGMLRVHPSYRYSSKPWKVTEVPLDRGVSGQVAMTGKPQRIGNIQAATDYLNADHQTVSELCVPIKFKEHILGVINAESTRPDAFTEDDERLLITLAGQVATAMEQIHRAQAERKWLDQLAHSNDLIYALAQITTHIEKAFGIDDILRNLGTELEKLNLTYLMAVYDRERDLFHVNYTSLEPGLLEIVENSLGYPLIKYSFTGNMLKPEALRHATVLTDPVGEIRMLFARTHRRGVSKLLEEIGVGPAAEPLRLPLTFEENVLGILWVWGAGLTRADLPIMSIFAKQVGISLERARLFQEVQSLALTDPLTGLHNRRSLFELGRLEFSRAHRMDREFSCMMLDLDHFKQINDTHGHPAGDQVLKEFAYRCKSSVREIDLVGRYGGEEVIILLPDTNRKLAMQVAERLRASIAATPINVSSLEIPLTVSIGVATMDEHTLHLETLIARADQAMYIAKHRGRNRIAISK